jgi:hypothetical protein
VTKLQYDAAQLTQPRGDSGEMVLEPFPDNFHMRAGDGKAQTAQDKTVVNWLCDGGEA